MFLLLSVPSLAAAHLFELLDARDGEVSSCHGVGEVGEEQGLPENVVHVRDHYRKRRKKVKGMENDSRTTKQPTNTPNWQAACVRTVEASLT